MLVDERERRCRNAVGAARSISQIEAGDRFAVLPQAMARREQLAGTGSADAVGADAEPVRAQQDGRAASGDQRGEQDV
jgi:hypothetical protein